MGMGISHLCKKNLFQMVYLDFLNSKYFFLDIREVGSHMETGTEGNHTVCLHEQCLCYQVFYIH